MGKDTVHTLESELAALRADNARLRAEICVLNQETSELLQRESRYRMAVAATNGVVYLLNFRTNQYNFLDEGIERLIGYSTEETTPDLWKRIAVFYERRGEILGYPPDEAERKFRAGEIKVWTADYECRTKTGEKRWLSDASVLLRDSSGDVYGCLGILQDITGRKRLQEELLQAQKMESIGRLAGGIAHDFNNLLTVILGYVELAQDQLEPDGPLFTEMEGIRKAGERASALTTQLLAFARKQRVELQLFEINGLISNLETMLRRLIGEHIVLEFDLQPDTGYIRADTSHIEQMLINLAVNARDAMPDGGKLRIESGWEELDEKAAQEYGLALPGTYVRLRVIDTGCGMDADALTHIFEPFYTTKEFGRGTGLGLATCYGIVEQSGGRINVVSNPGVGSTFTIHLPRVVGDGFRSTIVAEGAERLGGRETILLVEDETQVRLIAAQGLRTQGYRVLEAADGLQALTVSKSYTGQIDLLVSDVVMPQMGGKDLADRLLEERPAVRVLFTSGYTDNMLNRTDLEAAGIPLLMKPYTPHLLASWVRRVLAGGNQAGNTGQEMTTLKHAQRRKRRR